MARRPLTSRNGRTQELPLTESLLCRGITIALAIAGDYMVYEPSRGGLYVDANTLALINFNGFNSLNINNDGSLTYNTNPVWHDGLYNVSTFIRTTGNQIITGFLDIVGDLVGTRVQSYDGTFYGSTTGVNIAPAVFSGAAGTITVRPDGTGSTTGQLEVTTTTITHGGAALLKAADLTNYARVTTTNTWQLKQTFTVGLAVANNQNIELGTGGAGMFGASNGSVAFAAGAAVGAIMYWRPNGVNSTTGQVSLNSSGLMSGPAATFTGNVTAGGFVGNLSGNAATATTLSTSPTINGTAFNGSANIVTAQWGASRTITIGSTGKAVNGSANVTWTLADLGAATAAQGAKADSAVQNLYGTYAARPAASSANSGSLYYASDTLECYRSTGSAWLLLGRGGAELGHAERTTPYSTTSTAFADIPGLAVDYVAGEGAAFVLFGGTGRTSSAAVAGVGGIFVDGVQMGQILYTSTPFLTMSMGVRISGKAPGSTVSVRIRGRIATAGQTFDLFGDPADRPFVRVVTG